MYLFYLISVQDNIYLTNEGIIKLSGFRAAVYVSDYNGDENDDIMDNILILSPYWSAPEIVERCSRISTAADIWSIGCLSIELFNNNPPYYDLKPINAQNCILQNNEPPLPSNASKVFKDLIAWKGFSSLFIRSW